MYENKVHSVPDRIVSISQPYIRPIARGKAKAPVEFGAKLDLSIDENGIARLERLSFDAYNESDVFITAVENYKSRTGHYPERVLVDQIYRNRTNRAFCSEHGIRISGPALGRPKKDNKVDKKQEYIDNNDRIEVERAFSLAKRRYGLGLITAKLDTNTKSSKEIKILLSKEQYEKIEKVFSWKKKFTQINFYYGDLEKIDENGELTVRVRQNGDNYKLQIKKPVVYDEALHIKEEYERDIKDLPDKILGEQLKDILGMDFPDFYMLGKLETQRKVFYPNRDVEISLDMSTYFGKVDYEIEIEFGKEVPSELLLLLADNGIKPKEKTDGKFARFMSGYLKINK